MARILVTGGTVFVSRHIANYFAKTHEVFVLNRGTRPQPAGTTLIKADRHALGDALRGQHFDAVIDVCAYTAQDVNALLDALDGASAWVLISSSAVYPETAPQPFREDGPTGPNSIWGAYGVNKLAAEKALLARRADAYIIRPPYLYGPGENVYREPFVFDCAMQNRTFALPCEGDMPLQFFHVTDLCRVIEVILTRLPDEHIFNVGNAPVTVRKFVECCYRAAGKPLRTVAIHGHPNQRDYFPFYNYAYALDTARQQTLLPETIDLAQGLREAYLWHVAHPEDVQRRPYMEFIDAHFR